MAEASSTGAKAVAEKIFYRLARTFVALHKPTVVAVAGSIGKTSTKLSLSTLLKTEKNVSCMDDSYNNGLGLYLSVFELKVPAKSTPLSWLWLLCKALWRLIVRHPQILIVEYGIDHPGDMRIMTSFIQPDASLLTAVTPEHMEYMQTMDAVGEEETQIITDSKRFGVANVVDIDAKYLAGLEKKWYGYGDSKSDTTDGYFQVKEFTTDGARIDLFIDGETISDVTTKIISTPLIRQMTGAAVLAHKLGISPESLRKGLESIEPVAGRMRLLYGIKESLLIDDTANFSPVAGVAALQTLKRMPAKRRIAILGNMHELGDYIAQGYAEVGVEFDGIDILILVGEMSIEHFGEIARAKGYVDGTTLYRYHTSTEAGAFVRDQIIAPGDVVVIKGPFGGYFLEETTKKLLANPADSTLLTRQSDFWLRKKRAQFGDSLDL